MPARGRAPRTPARVAVDRPLEPDVDGVAAGALGLGGDLGGQRAQRGAAALELVAQVVAAGSERVGAGREPLARGAEARQPPPRLGSLAVALGQPRLDLGRASW